MTSETSLKYRSAAYRGDEPFAFFSYSHDDSSLVFAEFEALSEAGIRFYYDEGIHPGHEWRDELAKAIQKCAVFVLFVTERSIASRNCQRELALAADYDRPVLAVHLEDVELPPGVRLAIGDRQAIVRSRFDDARYRERLIGAIHEHVGALDVPVAPIAKPPPDKRRRALVAAVVVVLAAVTFALLWHREQSIATVPAIADASVAVLPLVPIGDDPSLKTLGQALTEQITNELAGRTELRVTSRAPSSEQAGNDGVSIARWRGVGYELEGSVRLNGDRIRVTAQLVRGENGTHVWSDTFDAAETEADWDQIASNIAVLVASYLALEVQLEDTKKLTTSAEAHDHYAAAERLGWQYRNSGTATQPWNQILDDVDRTIALDPNFVPAHLSRVMVFGTRFFGRGGCGERCIVESQQSINRALAIAPDDPNVLLGLSFLQIGNDLDPAAAAATLQRVRSIDPDNQRLNWAFANLAMFRGNVREAHEYVVRQLDVTPDATTHLWHAFVLRALGDLDKAERAFNSAMRLAPRGQFHIDATIGHINLLIERGEMDRANAEYAPLWAEYRYTQPERFVAVLALLGHEQEARSLADKLSQDSDTDPWNLVHAYAALGQYDDALAWLRKVIDGRYPYVVQLRMPNQFIGLQEQPGYADVLKYLESQQKSR